MVLPKVGQMPTALTLPWPPPPPLEVLYPLLDPPVRPLPASCLVSRPFVPHQGLSRERPLSCREVLTAAPALALLCLSLGGHLLSWEGGKKLVTLARSCHVPLQLSVVAGGHGAVAQGLGLGSWCSSTCRGRAPGPAEGLQGWGCQISGVQRNV